MNVKAKRRVFVVAGIIIVVAIIAFAMLGSTASAQTVTVGELKNNATTSSQKVKVSGNVVAGSATSDDGGISFSIVDPDGDPGEILAVRYEGAASSTFGNGVTAICTGRLDDQGVLQANELVTKCPSKYESSTDALTVEQLLNYGDAILDKPVKVTGYILDGEVASMDKPIRFVLTDSTDSTSDASTSLFSVPISYQGAMEEATDFELVLTGSLGGDGVFTATDVARVR